MSSQKSKSAFPYQHNNGFHESGMSMRDYFAAKAMQAFCGHSPDEFDDADDMAVNAYEVADAMLRARNLGEPK